MVALRLGGKKDNSLRPPNSIDIGHHFPYYSNENTYIILLLLTFYILLLPSHLTIKCTAFYKAYRGHYAEMLRHPAAAHVVDDLYLAEYTDTAQRNSMAAEFYGREYSLFEGGLLNNLEGPPAHLSDLLAAVDGNKQKSIMQQLAADLSPIFEKGLVDAQLAHRLAAEYLANAPAGLVIDAVESLSGEALLHMLHTKDGATAACMVIGYGSAKERKKAVKAMKGHVGTAVVDEWGHLAIATALSVVDDTTILNKFIISAIQVSCCCFHRLMGRCR